MTTTGSRAHRPNNRKAQILAAAVDAFHRSGYHATSMEDIATTVGITAGALYRHFRGKQELLAQGLVNGLDLLEEAVRNEEGLDALLRSIARFSVEHRAYAALWDKETQTLSVEQRAEIRQRHKRIIGTVAAAVQSERHELSATDAHQLALAATAVLVSPSYHHTTLPTSRFETLLWERASEVCRTSALPVTGTATRPAERSVPGLSPATRREALLLAGMRMFKERGFQAVSMEDIGAAVGIAGPSVYKHFAGKAELLAAVVRREAEALWFALDQALTVSSSPAQALVRVLRSFASSVTVLSGSVALVISELGYLAPAEQQTFRRTQLDYLTEWVSLLTASRPDLNEAEARVTVHAVFALVSVAARTPLLERPLPTALLIELGLDVLGMPATDRLVEPATF